MTKTKQRSVILRPHEARRLAAHGEVLCVSVVKPQPHPSCSEDGCGWHWHPEGRDDHYVFGTDEAHLLSGMLDYYPFGRVGDVLWGREAWADAMCDGGPVFCYRADSGRRYLDIDAWPIEYERYPGCRFANWASDLERGIEGVWRSSSQMPSWASRFPRLVLEKIECRRITTLTEDEARRTGIEPVMVDTGGVTPWDTWIEVPDWHEPLIEVLGLNAWADDAWFWFATLKVSDAC